MKKIFSYLAATGALCYSTACLLVACSQRKMMYLPSHDNLDKLAAFNGLKPWIMNGQRVGFLRETSNPEHIWLMFHGNAGQAAERGYVLPLIPQNDDFYVMEYPGYGQRPGNPTRESMSKAAEEVYAALRKAHPSTPLNLLGESMGSGPASHVSGMSPPPDRIVLMVPFARMSDLVQEKMSLLPTKMLLLDRWDNIAELADYQGRVDIYGAKHDQVIPPHHARRLAESKPGAIYHELDCAHNGWSEPGLVKF